MEPITYYKSQSEKHKHTLRQYQKQRNFITITKILIFAIIVWQIYIAINDGTPYFLYPLLVAIIAFIAMTRIDSKVVNHIRVTEALIRINEEENAYLQGDLSPFPAGKEYGHPSHPYACDLDLFGDDSLFRHLDRTVTHEGQRQLAEWLLTPCLQRQEILRRQEAVRELTALPSWRQLFRANGKTQKIQEINTENLYQWQQEPPFFHHKKRIRRILLFINGCTIATWGCTIAGILPYPIPLLLSLSQLLALSFLLKKINQYHNRLNTFISSISNYLPLVRLLERQPFTSSHLQKIKKLLFQDNQNALKALSSLKRIQEKLDQRGNLIAAFFLNGLYLRDMHTILDLDKWKEKYSACINQWTTAISQTDALASMANFSFNHPEYTFPVISDNYQLNAEGIGHPLLQNKKCVTNDFAILREHQMFIVTGANMAGKSTFLRTVGINLVLAQSGNVVRSARFDFHPTALFTSMRTTDNLAKDTSYFHAELLRLKQLIEMAKQEHVFIILDEMLKGTNSVDKLNGSLAFLRKLLQYPVTGLIATHDLALGELENEYPENFFNVCFEITHQGEEIQYDYKLHKGVSTTMNASILLKQMGLI